ncbi:MAG: flagellar protein FlgN [Myxococcota bacterium]
MSLVTDHVTRLEAVLLAEEELYLRMRGVLQREESELVLLEARVLEETVEEKRTLAEEAQLLEESRIIVARALGDALGLPAGPLKLSLLIEAAGEDGERLISLYHRLRALIKSTQSLLNSNERFANRSLSRVQETLRLLGQTVPAEGSYGPGSRREGGAGRGRLVRQAI